MRRAEPWKGEKSVASKLEKRKDMVREKKGVWGRQLSEKAQRSSSLEEKQGQQSDRRS